MTPYWFVIVVVIFHICWHHFHETPCVQHHNIFLKGHAMICTWGHGCWVSYKMKSTKGITIFITNTILWDTWMLHQNEIYFFQQDFVYLRTYEWTTLAIQTLKECFYRLQLFTIQIFQKQTTPTEPKLEAHLAVGNTLACQSQLESWNMSYFHSSLNCLNSSAFIEESNQNWSHSFWIKIKACH